MKTAELIGPALDWAVAKCEGGFGIQQHTKFHNKPWFFYQRYEDEPDVVHHFYLNEYEPSTDWAQGGPIIEREGGFHLKIWLESRPDTKCEAHIHNYDGDWIQFGPTPLIAAMRVYVASKMGDEIEIPEGLS